MFHRTNHSTHRSVRPVIIGLGTITAITAAVFFAPLAASAAEPGDDDFLGVAEDYAIISADEITDTATHGTVVIGDVALTPGSEQQLGIVQVVGTIHVNDTAAATADSNLNTAYVILANAGATETIAPLVNLAARATPYGPGVYFSGDSLLLDGTMTLEGGADDVFIFQASTETLTVTAGSVVQLLGAVQACNVYWQVGSSATLGVDSVFVGTILAATSIAAQDGAQITGQLLAGATNAGGVTLDDNFIDNGSPCIRVTSVQRVLGDTVEADRVEAARVAALGAPTVLAETGIETDALLIAAALLFGFGVAAVLISRRRGAELEQI